MGQSDNTLDDSLKQIRDRSAATLADLKKIRQNANDKDIQSALSAISRANHQTLEALDEIAGKRKSGRTQA
jgi:predicted exporter